MDIVLGCVDNDEARLAINRACRSVGVPWINSGILGFSGNVMIFGREGACYECNVTPDQVEDSRSRYDSCENVRKRFLKEERMPTVQITSALVSALQVQEAIKLLHNQFPALGKRIAINGLTNNYAVINLQPYENCLAHGTYETIIELPLQAQTNTLGELAALVVAQLGPQAVIDLGRRFIQEIRCRQCSEWVKLMRPAHRVYDDELICQGCRQNWQHPQTAVDRATHRLETFTPKNFDVANSEYLRSLSQISVPDIPPDWQKLSLWDLGMPPLHIFTAHNPQGDQITLELTGDLTTVFADLNVG
jgi:adenylyltransferase/sulfurtransferase